MSLSSYASKGSRLNRRVPAKRADSCATMVRRRRRSLSLRVLMSMPSMTMRPEVGSMNRKNDRPRVLLPDPVRPQIPTFSCDADALVEAPTRERWY
jgi:hypothetical protein